MGMNIFANYLSLGNIPISTHTPVWGWTHYNPFSYIHSDISTHTPYGDERNPSSFFPKNGNFNPHPRMEMNRWMQMMFIACLITTHTPVWGWTLEITITSRSTSFQPTPPHGGWTVCTTDWIFTDSYFNPHPCMGMNLCHYIATHQNLLQPTSPHGDEHTKRKSLWNSTRIITTHTPHGDERHTTNWKETIIYFNTHLPHGGWTDSWYLQTNPMTTFQPTPPRGMNGGFQILQRITGNYNPHPRMGMNCGLLVILHRSNYFNPHPRMGMNAILYMGLRVMTYFNPHPRMGMNLYRA